jgi:hypothetical protein
MVYGESQLTLRGSGQSKVTGVELKAVCRRCTSTLALFVSWLRQYFGFIYQGSDLPLQKNRNNSSLKR